MRREHREVMQRVTQSRQDAGAAHDLAPEVSANAPGSLLAFVSLSRVASGDATIADVLALGSRLLADVVPGATGAWYVPDADARSADRRRRASARRRRRCAA